MFRKNRQDDTKSTPSESTPPKPIFPVPPSNGAAPVSGLQPTAPTPQQIPSALTPRPRPAGNGMSFSSPNPTGQRATPSIQQGELRTLVIGHGISVQGTVQDVERLVIEGTIEANLIRAKEFVVAQGGIFRGTLEVDKAEIAGTMDGDITVLDNLNLLATGKLIGKASCHRLQVEDGGQVTGQLEMISKAPQQQSHAKVPTPSLLSKPEDHFKEE